MCNNDQPLEACMEDFINPGKERKLSVQYNLEDLPSETDSYKTFQKLEKWPNFTLPSTAGKLCRISRRLQLGLNLKSKSDSSICISCSAEQDSLTGCRDVEMSFPSDSDITIFKVQKKSRLRRIMASDTWEVVLGDGSHLAESPSMVNLATLVQGGEAHRHDKREHVLVPLSSWDQVESLSTATSETVVSTSRVVHQEPTSSLVSFAMVHRFYPKDALRRSEIPPEMARGETEVEEHGKKSDEVLDLSKSSSGTKITCGQLPTSSEEVIADLNLQVVTLKQALPEAEERVHVKVSARLQKALRRVVCSCFAVKSDRDEVQGEI